MKGMKTNPFHGHLCELRHPARRSDAADMTRLGARSCGSVRRFNQKASGLLHVLHLTR